MASKPALTETMHKITGTIDLLFGGGQIGIGFMNLLVVTPRIGKVYEDFGAPKENLFGLAPMVVVILLGVANLIIGGLLLSKSGKNKNTLFWAGIFSIIISLILTPLLFSFSSFLSLAPLYNLAN